MCRFGYMIAKLMKRLNPNASTAPPMVPPEMIELAEEIDEKVHKREELEFQVRSAGHEVANATMLLQSAAKRFDNIAALARELQE